jgi:uracil-DNA glycosylase family 4
LNPLTRNRWRQAREAPQFSPSCRDCPRLAAHLDAIRLEHPGYHAAPVASFGDPRARLLIVGLAPGLHGANRTGRPFTGDHAGVLLYETLYRLGFASQPTASGARDGMRLRGCRITNAVKCLPPGNRPRSDEVERCNRYLRAELATLPHEAMILALGRVAHGAVLNALRLPGARYPFSHGARHALPGARVLYDSYHCSRYNTQTGRLTAAMFQDVVRAIARELAAPTDR